MRLTANYVTCETQDGVAMLGFADDEFNTTQYIMLQRQLTPPSPQDREAGLDRPHIEVNSPTQSGYGGVAKADLQQNRLVLELNPNAAADMSVDDTIEIAFHLPVERLKKVGDQLRLILGKDRVQIDGQL